MILKYNNIILQGDLKEIENSVSGLEKFKNRTVLVTGAGGMLAKYIVFFLMYLNEKENSNTKILALVRNVKKAEKDFEDLVDNKNFEFIVQDVCDPIKYNKKVDYIIHAAGSASPSAIINNPEDIVKANVLGTMNVLDFSKENKVEKVVYFSTREIYGNLPEGVVLVSEDIMGSIDPVVFRNCYPMSKKMGESLFKVYETNHNLNMNILRIAHVYGPGMKIDNDGRVMADMIYSAVNSQDILFNSDGTVIRAFCYISDAISGILNVMLNASSGEVYNLANESQPLPIRDIAKIIKEAFPERNIDVKYSMDNGFKKGGYNKMRTIKLDMKKINHLGWKPKVSLKDGILRTVKSFK